MAARPARTGFTRYTQPDGTVILIQKHGDEWGHWETDDKGNVVAKSSDGFYRMVSGVDAKSVADKAAARRRARRATASMNAPKAPVAVGQKHFLLILVQFKDKSFTYTHDDVNNMMNQKGYSAFGATGSGRDFYYDSSNGYFEPIFDVYGPVTLSKDYSYYGANDKNGDDKYPHVAVEEACKALGNEIDFSMYDNDNDGKVDLVYMFYAGFGEADDEQGDSNTIWPHQWNLSEAGNSFKLDGKTIDRYACSNELIGYGESRGTIDGIGAICHEFGHAMGLPDFYDSDYTTNGNAGGLYDFSTMCGGSYNNDSRTPPYFNVEERILLGWVSESEAFQEFTSSGNYTIPALRPENGQAVAYKTPTDMEGEYFVYECRGNQGWDAYNPGSGLIVYHVDKSSRKVSISGAGSIAASYLWTNWDEYNAINENGSHPCFYIIPAASQSSLDYSGKQVNIPFPGGSSVKSYTAKSWNNVEGDFALSNIDFASEQSTFTVTKAVALSGVDWYAIANPGNGSYKKGASFPLEVLPPTATAETPSVSWTYDDTAISGSAINLSSSGQHTIEATLTFAASGRKDILTLEITVQ